MRKKTIAGKPAKKLSGAAGRYHVEELSPTKHKSCLQYRIDEFKNTGVIKCELYRAYKILAHLLTGSFEGRLANISWIGCIWTVS
jgi:hypothetical protein